MGGDPESNPAETEAIKGEEAPEAKEKPAAEEHNYIVRGNLKLRAGESLTSEAVGNIEAGTTVYVVDRKNLADGHDRALIAVNKDTPLGWVSVHAKDGFEQLREIAPGEHHHDEIAKLGNIRNKHHRASIIEEMYSMKPVHHNDHHVHAQAPGTQVKGAPPGTITKPITHGEHGEHDEHEEGMGIDHSDQWVCAVRRCVLLQHQPQSVLKFVMQATRPIGSSEGQVIYQQGDSLAEGKLYLVDSGVYRVTIETGQEGRLVTRRTRDYGPQENFGASELLCNDTNGVRKCTVVCIQPGMVWGIPKRIIDQKLRVPPSLPPELLEFCHSVKLFHGISHDRLLQLCRGAIVTELEPGETIAVEGGHARSLFAIKRGSVVTQQSDSTFSLTIKPPETMGESALAADDDMRVRTSSILAGEDGATVISWAVSAIETLVGFDLQAGYNALNNRRMLQDVKIGDRYLASGLEKDQMDLLLESMEEVSHTAKHMLVTEGEMDSNLYIIRTGDASITWEGCTPSQAIHLKRGDCYGEQSIVSKEAMRRAKRKTNVLVSSKCPTLVAGVISTRVVEEMRSQYDWFDGWWQALVEHVAATAVPGLDAVVVAKLQEEGADQKARSALLPDKATKKAWDGKHEGKVGDVAKKGSSKETKEPKVPKEGGSSKEAKGEKKIASKASPDKNSRLSGRQSSPKSTRPSTPKGSPDKKKGTAKAAST